MLFVVVLTFTVLLVMLKLICISMTSPPAFVLLLHFFLPVYSYFGSEQFPLFVYNSPLLACSEKYFILLLYGIIKNVGNFYMLEVLSSINIENREYLNRKLHYFIYCAFNYTIIFV